MPKPRIRQLEIRDLQLVRLGPDAAAPRRFAAVVELGESELELVIELDTDQAPRCRSLSVRGRDVTADALREIPVAALVGSALERATQPYRQANGGGILVFSGAAERERIYERVAEGARRPRKGSPLTDDTLGRVAELYRAAVAQGDPPTQTVADAMHASRSTAARWVTKARERGFLGPALRGRAGEAS